MCRLASAWDSPVPISACGTLSLGCRLGDVHGGQVPAACRIRWQQAGLRPGVWLACAGGRPSFYSHSNAPGLIMAVGNTGSHLDLTADQLCTWLSRGGGVSWEDVYEGAGIYEFGDHGGLLLLAPHRGQQPASQVMFSIDEGLCWHTIPLAEAIDIDNIRCLSVTRLAAQRHEMMPACKVHSLSQQSSQAHLISATHAPRHLHQVPATPRRYLKGASQVMRRPRQQSDDAQS